MHPATIDDSHLLRRLRRYFRFGRHFCTNGVAHSLKTFDATAIVALVAPDRCLELHLRRPSSDSRRNHAPQPLVTHNTLPSSSVLLRLLPTSGLICCFHTRLSNLCIWFSLLRTGDFLPQQSRVNTIAPNDTHVRPYGAALVEYHLLDVVSSAIPKGVTQCDCLLRPLK